MSRPFTEKEINLIRRLYPDTDTREISQMLGRSLSGVYRAAAKLGIRKTKEYMTSLITPEFLERGMKTRFKKGHLPPNLGKKMPKEIYEKVRPTMFKKGNIPHNARKVGSELTRKDGTVYIKVVEKKIPMPKHRVVWESVNGPIPPGYNVCFKDGNKSNCSIENLILLSNAERMKKNTIHRYPANVRDAMRSIGRIRRLIREQDRKEAQ